MALSSEIAGTSHGVSSARPDEPQRAHHEVNLVERDPGSTRGNTDASLEQALDRIAGHRSDTEQEAELEPSRLDRDGAVPRDSRLMHVVTTLPSTPAPNPRTGLWLPSHRSLIGRFQPPVRHERRQHVGDVRGRHEVDQR
jgi:hypothetical protein